MEQKEATFFSCILDDFQDYIYEGFGTILNKSRSANVGVVFCHQALGDLSKVSEAFKNVVLTNTNIKVVMRNTDPDTCDHFSRSFGTGKSIKKTFKVVDNEATGDESAREVEKFRFHPNDFKELGLGEGVLSIPHPGGVKLFKVKFQPLKELPRYHLPDIPKKLVERKFPKPDETVAVTTEEIHQDRTIESQSQTGETNACSDGANSGERDRSL